MSFLTVVPAPSLQLTGIVPALSVAFVVLKPGAAFARPSLDGALARFKHPKEYFVVETLPRNALGKVLKKDLRAPYWEGAGRSL